MLLWRMRWSRICSICRNRRPKETRKWKDQPPEPSKHLRNTAYCRTVWCTCHRWARASNIIPGKRAARLVNRSDLSWNAKEGPPDEGSEWLCWTRQLWLKNTTPVWQRTKYKTVSSQGCRPPQKTVSGRYKSYDDEANRWLLTDWSGSLLERR